MSSIQPKKQDLDGVEYLSANETTNIKISGDDSSSNGARIELGKDLTTTPIISHLSGDGFDFGVLGDFTFPQMVLSKLKTIAVETPFPATDTLKINKKILLDDGTNTGTLDINGTGDLEISSSGNIQLNPTGAIGIGGANYGTAGQVLTSNGASAPTLTTPTFPTQTYSCNVLTNGNVKGTGTAKFIVIGNFVQVQATISLTLIGDTNGRIGLSLPTTIPFVGASNVVTLGSFKFIRFGVAWYIGSAFSPVLGEIAGISYGTADYMGIQNPTLTLQVGDLVSMSVSYFHL